MSRTDYNRTATALSMMLMILTACAGSAPTRFYILNPIAGSSERTRAETVQPHVTLGIGPVAFPAYLDRQQIVTRVSDNELHLAGFDEWVEPLKDNFTRVLVENLERLLPADSFTVFPFRGLESPDWQVEVEVIRLDGSLAGDASLLARWSIFKKEDNDLLLTKKSSFREPTAGPGYEAFVAAHSRVLEALSREMAGLIQALSKGKDNP